MPSIWWFLVFGVTYVIYGRLAGFGRSFQTGDASLFMLVLLVSAVAEGFLVRFSGEKKRKAPRLLGALLAIAVVVCIVANVHFVTNQRRESAPDLDIVQIVVFGLSIYVATFARFALVPISSIFDICKNYRMWNSLGSAMEKGDVHKRK